MKVFKYDYYEPWGAGQGIVIAESIDDAKKLMHAPYSQSDKTFEQIFPNLIVEEVDITKPQVIDHSWCE